MTIETAALRSRVEELEALLGLQREPALGVLFKLSPSLGKLLGLLIATPNVTPEMVEDRRIATSAKVAVHRLRKDLMPWDIKIRSKRSLGYWLDDETKERIKALITPQGNF